MVKNLTQVDNLDQTFKVFEGEAFDEKIHSLEDTLDILGLLSGRESSELAWVSWVTKDYNLWSTVRPPYNHLISFTKIGDCIEVWLIKRFNY